MKQARWVRISGAGLVHTGPCLLLYIIMCPDANHDYTDIYDGRDTTSGKKFMRVSTSTRTTQHIPLTRGVRFDVGIYVDGYDAVVDTTVVFIALPLRPAIA